MNKAARIEFEIGSVQEFKGEKFVVEEGKTCVNCIYNDRDCPPLACTKAERSDEKNVEFRQFND